MKYCQVQSIHQKKHTSLHPITLFPAPKACLPYIQIFLPPIMLLPISKSPYTQIIPSYSQINPALHPNNPLTTPKSPFTQSPTTSATNPTPNSYKTPTLRKCIKILTNKVINELATKNNPNRNQLYDQEKIQVILYTC